MSEEEEDRGAKSLPVGEESTKMETNKEHTTKASPPANQSNMASSQQESAPPDAFPAPRFGAAPQEHMGHSASAPNGSTNGSTLYGPQRGVPGSSPYGAHPQSVGPYPDYSQYGARAPYGYPSPYGAPQGRSYYNYPSSAGAGGGGYYNYSPAAGYGYAAMPTSFPSQQTAPAQHQGQLPAATMLTDRPKSPALSVGKSDPLPPLPEPDLTVVPNVNVELERQRAATDPPVEPMKTAFHYFTEDVMEEIRQAAEKEVGKDDKTDLYLLNSNINARLIHAWETTEKAKRDEYFRKEEEDRKRYMENEEILIRHCATTLTGGRLDLYDYDDDDASKRSSKRSSPSNLAEDGESSKRSKGANGEGSADDLEPVPLSKAIKPDEEEEEEEEEEAES